LRDLIRNDIKSVLLPLYKKFLEKYETVKFSDNPNKYIKYSVGTLEQMLDQFFEESQSAHKKSTVAGKLLKAVI